MAWDNNGCCVMQYAFVGCAGNEQAEQRRSDSSREHMSMNANF